MLSEWIKHRLIGTPLQWPAQKGRELWRLRKQKRHPELADIFAEGAHSRLILRTVIRDGMHCVDVGAHLGAVLSEMRRLSPSGRHLAVEPLAYKAAWLRRKYPDVEVCEVAISDQGDELEFTWNKTRSGFSGFARPHRAADQTETVTVFFARLDDLVPPDRRIGFLKVDVEGAEVMVFRTAPRILTENRPVVLFECARRSTEAMGFDASDVFEILTETYGYHILLLKDFLGSGSPLDVPSFKQAMVYPFKAFNFVAVPAA